MSLVSLNKITALGTYEVRMIFDDIIVNHNFFVMPNEINIPTHGILGKDFIKTLYKSKIDNENMKLILKINGMYKELPILESTSSTLGTYFTTTVNSKS